MTFNEVIEGNRTGREKRFKIFGNKGSLSLLSGRLILG